MALIDDKLSMATQKLGRYFSIVSKEDFMAVLAWAGDDPGSFGTEDLDNGDVLNQLVRLLTNTTEGGIIVNDIVLELNDLLSGDTDGAVARGELDVFVLRKTSCVS